MTPTLRDLGEFGFIERVARMAGLSPTGPVIFGDDCAVLDVGGPEKLLVSTDAAIEGRHFRLDWFTPVEIGRRAVAAALSDVAAMGGRPLACLCTIVIPPHMSSSVALGVMRGVAETAMRYGAPLIGGDTVTGTGGLALDIVTLGWAERPWLRKGARQGDKLLVTGALGGPAAALALLQSDPELLREPGREVLLRRATDPTPRFAEAAALAGTGLVHAAIDISDGLYQDAGHLARMSRARVVLQSRQLPICAGCDAGLAAGEASVTAPWWAATSGEEYELLLAVDRDEVAEVQRVLTEAGLDRVTDVGDLVPGEGVVLVGLDGSEIELERGGWDHLRSAD